MRLHIYMDKALHAKYLALLPDAEFQKGCINFTEAEQMPAATVTAFITECALVNMKEVLENRKKRNSPSAIQYTSVARDRRRLHKRA